ncbi:hypothetical protein Sjap_001068 [Stephania japonica]|uniref:Uncharacterized protein n=1 Tax=Stephania japonica TaxID=461633 RepID=A0AAP0KKU1_9MAGN
MKGRAGITPRLIDYSFGAPNELLKFTKPSTILGFSDFEMDRERKGGEMRSNTPIYSLNLINCVGTFLDPSVDKIVSRIPSFNELVVQCISTWCLYGVEITPHLVLIRYGHRVHLVIALVYAYAGEWAARLCGEFGSSNETRGYTEVRDDRDQSDRKRQDQGRQDRRLEQQRGDEGHVGYATAPAPVEQQRHQPQHQHQDRDQGSQDKEQRDQGQGSFAKLPAAAIAEYRRSDDDKLREKLRHGDVRDGQYEPKYATVLVFDVVDYSILLAGPLHCIEFMRHLWSCRKPPCLVALPSDVVTEGVSEITLSSCLCPIAL